MHPVVAVGLAVGQVPSIVPAPKLAEDTQGTRQEGRTCFLMLFSPTQLSFVQSPAGVDRSDSRAPSYFCSQDSQTLAVVGGEGTGKVPLSMAGKEEGILPCFRNLKKQSPATVSTLWFTERGCIHATATPLGQLWLSEHFRNVLSTFTRSHFSRDYVTYSSFSSYTIGSSRHMNMPSAVCSAPLPFLPPASIREPRNTHSELLKITPMPSTLPNS